MAFRPEAFDDTAVSVSCPFVILFASFVMMFDEFLFVILLRMDCALFVLVFMLVVWC